MAKKNIEKILTTGTPKQRALLMAEDRARSTLSQERLLTDNEFIQLSNSFKRPNEIKLWDEFIELDDKINSAITNLEGLKVEVLSNSSILRGYILVWDTLENAEQLVNAVLHEIKDPKERKRIAEDGAKDVDLLFSKTETDPEGYIEIKIDFEQDSCKENKPKKYQEYTLWYVMNGVKKTTENSIIKYLSWERATLDFMKERGFNVKAYKERIKRITAIVHSPLIGWAKYSGELNESLLDWAPPRLKEIIKKYDVCPNIDELKINEDQYNWFRRSFLDGKDYSGGAKGKVNKNSSYE